MITFACRSPALRGLYGVIAVCLAISVGDATSGAAQDRATEPPVGDMWRGEAPEPSWTGEQAAAGYAQRSERHQAFMESGVPPAYRNARSPYSEFERLIPEGRALYTVNCMHCHGPRGFGEGDPLMDLRPTRMFLAFMINTPDLVDEYLMWTIAGGGAEFGSSMPSYGDRLTGLEIWKIVFYMRAGFPGSEVPQ